MLVGLLLKNLLEEGVDSPTALFFFLVVWGCFLGSFVVWRVFLGVFGVVFLLNNS
jgi:hypothetical protein